MTTYTWHYVAMPLFYLSGIYKQSLNLTNLKKDALKLLCLRIVNIEILLVWVSSGVFPITKVRKAVVELTHNIKCRGMDHANYVPCISLMGILLQAPRRCNKKPPM